LDRRNLFILFVNVESNQTLQIKILLQISFAQKQKSSWRATTTTTTYPGDFHHRCIVDFLWRDSSLSTVLPFGLWKNQSGLLSSLFRLDEPFLFVLCRYPCTKPQGKRNDNNHYLVDCWFPFCSVAILIAMDWFALANILLIDRFDPSMQVSLQWASFALAYEDSLVRRNCCRDRTCDSSLQLSLRPNSVVRRWSYSFAIIIASDKWLRATLAIAWLTGEHRRKQPTRSRTSSRSS